MDILFENNNNCWEANYLYNRVLSYLKYNWHNIVNDYEMNFDCIILNWCNSSVLYNNETFLKINAYKNDKKIFIIWCQANNDNIELHENIIKISIWKEIILDTIFKRTMWINEISSIEISYFNNYNDIYTIQVSRGCIYNCSYCFIKQWIWYVKSKTIEEVVLEYNYGSSFRI